MKLIFTDLLKTVVPMSELGKKENIPFPAAYAISKNIVAIDRALKDYEKRKNALIKEYAKKVKNLSESPNDLDNEYKERLNQLGFTEMEVDISPIPVKALERIDLAPFDVLAIDFMLVE